MGGWNQSQAHAQFVTNIVDYGMNIQEALEAGRFTKGTFGYGRAVMSHGSGVHFGASEPRHDGAAIPEAPPVFLPNNP